MEPRQLPHSLLPTVLEEEREKKAGTAPDPFPLHKPHVHREKWLGAGWGADGSSLSFLTVPKDEGGCPYPLLTQQYGKGEAGLGSLSKTITPYNHFRLHYGKAGSGATT